MEQMSLSIGGKRIKDLVLPGTHDSASYSCDTKYGFLPMAPTVVTYPCIKNLALSWAISQRDNLYGQLCKGARYLDLRVCKSTIDMEIRTEHTVLGEKYQQLLKDIGRFADENPKEIIVLCFSHFRYNKKYPMSYQDHKNLCNMIKETLGDKLINRNEEFDTINELWSKNKQILIIYQHDLHDLHDLHNHDFLINGYNTMSIPWANKPRIGQLLTSLETIVNNRDNKQYFCLQCCVTPDTLTIVKGIICCNPTSLLQLGDNVCEPINNFLLKYKSTRKLNFVIFDSIGSASDIVTMLVEMNNVIWNMSSFLTH